MKKIAFFSLLTFSSCFFSRDEPKIVIKNNSNHFFDSILVNPSFNTPTVFYSIKPKEKVKGKIFFDENEFSDGAYNLRLYKQDALYKNLSFGYFTNGASLSRKFSITIETDTIKIKED